MAQSLYENGHITYMRTDSTTLATVAVEAARQLVAEQYGPEYLPAAPRVYQTKVKNAQEAHEAIRPAGHPFDFPEKLRDELSAEEFKLYDLIWKRTVASQMADARGTRLTVRIAGGGATFQASGKTIEFPGYLRAYVEGSDDPQAELAERDAVLPAVAARRIAGRAASCCPRATPRSRRPDSPKPRSRARWKRWASAGRAPTPRSSTRSWPANMSSSAARRWCPPGSRSPSRNLLEIHLPDLVDYQFTAQMEDDLDAISRGESEHVEYLRGFYFGNGEPDGGPA